LTNVSFNFESSHKNFLIIIAVNIQPKQRLNKSPVSIHAELECEEESSCLFCCSGDGDQPDGDDRNDHRDPQHGAARDEAICRQLYKGFAVQKGYGVVDEYHHGGSAEHQGQETKLEFLPSFLEDEECCCSDDSCQECYNQPHCLHLLRRRSRTTLVGGKESFVDDNHHDPCEDQGEGHRYADACHLLEHDECVCGVAHGRQERWIRDDLPVGDVLYCERDRATPNHRVQPIDMPRWRKSLPESSRQYRRARRRDKTCHVPTSC
jgi:hypothetical protein